MALFSKLFQALRGIWYMTRFVNVFDVKMLAGKRIAIVGPASSAINTGRGEYIDSFDVVIRINKAPSLIAKGSFKKDIGTKTDILFHSFFENDFSGGGPLDFELYDKLGIQYVVNPIPTYFGKRVTFNFYKKYGAKRLIYTLPRSLYHEDIAAFGKFRPTTGFCALKMVLKSDFSELLITGFTFFKTGYGDGYRDALKDVETNRKYITESNIHNPEIEYDQFRSMLKNISGKVVTDWELKHILLSDNIVIKEAPIETDH